MAFLQHIDNGDVLGAVLFAQAATGAIAAEFGGVHGDGIHAMGESRIAVNKAIVIKVEDARDVDPGRTRHTIAASGTGYFDALAQGIANLTDQGLLLRG